MGLLQMRFVGVYAGRSCVFLQWLPRTLHCGGKGAPAPSDNEVAGVKEIQHHPYNKQLVLRQINFTGA